MRMRDAMQTRWRAIAAAVAIVGLASSFSVAGNMATAAEPSQNIHDYVPEKLDDFTATMRVDHYDEHAGEKISKDFVYIYKLKGDVKLQYKEENMMRLDAQIGASNLTFIVNNATQYVRAAAVGLRTVNNLGQTPGKRKTLLDAGFISNGYLSLADAEFKRTQDVNGTMCALFRVSYKDKTLDMSHRLVWIDPKTKIVVKREEYSQKGKLNATYFYSKPTEVVPGIWFPTRIAVLNRDGQEAGVTLYRNIHVNQGLDESIFRL